MDSNISTDNTSTQNILAMPITNPVLSAEGAREVSVMFYVMKSMQDTLNGDLQCLQKQTKEEMEKEAIAKVLQTIDGLSNKKAFLQRLGISIGSSDPILKSYVNGLLESIVEQQNEEKKIKEEEEQAQAKMDADKDLTKYPAYEDKYVLTPDLKGEWSNFIHPKSFLQWIKAVWNGPENILSKKGREVWEMAGCKIAEEILKNPTAKKDIGAVVNSSTIKSLLGMDDKNKNSGKGILAQILAQATNHPLVADALAYSDKINKWLDKDEKYFSKKLNDLADKLEKDTSKGQTWDTYVFKAPKEFLLYVGATIDDMIFTSGTKSFHRMTGEGNYNITKDQTLLDTWKKDTSVFETNAQNISNLTLSATENKINNNMQQNKNTLNDLEQSVKSLNNYGEMLSRLVENNKV